MVKFAAQAMNITDIEREIEQYLVEVTDSPALREMITDEYPYVIKYLPPKHLATVLSRGELYASERSGFTWGDAIYVAPLSRPLSTMMYGQVGVVGKYPRTGRRFFDASNARGVDLYQEWIRHQTRAYRDLTTTVHASIANRELRNGFRSRFSIDCVFFRPDEPCQGYVDVAQDWWLAVTHWDAQHAVGHGFSPAITGLKWCVITPDAFEADGRGYKAYLYQSLTAPHFPDGPQQYFHGHYSSLRADVVSAYLASVRQVVICDFT